MYIKQILLTIVLMICLINTAISQEEQMVNNIEKYKQFGLVWGLLKYHHSEVSKGKYNWDKTFIENIDKLENIKTQIDLNHFLMDFILSITPNKIRTSNDHNNLFKENYDYDWIEMYSSNANLSKNLKMLRDNINIKDYYVSNNSLSKIPTFKNETGFNTFDHGILSHRLLTLFSFWNVIQYHYVNKYLMDVNWMHQLNSYVNKFISCDSELEYEKLKSELIASINDSHAYYLPHIINDSLFKYKPPFGTTLVNDTLVVSSLFNKNIAEKDDLKLGDLILEVRNMNIKSNIEDIVNPILSSSNKSFLKKWSRWILFNNENSINIKIKRKDSIINKSLNLYHDYEIKGYSLLKSFSINEKWKLIEGNIGYINLNSISKKELKNAFEEFSKAKGVIVDLRNYPKYVSESDITKYIYPNKIRFVNVLFPIPNRPSLAKFEESPLSIIKDPFKSGNRNSKYYDKPIILLVNSTTQSKAEYIGMAIQASPNCITVGEETAGSVMNVATFTLPDKSEVSFTSLGAFYPEGTGVQRKGLKIDYFIDENTSNFTKDQYIIKGIELIKSMNAED